MVQDFKLLHLRLRFKSTEVQWRCVADLKRTQSNSQGLKPSSPVKDTRASYSDQRFHALLFLLRSHPFLSNLCAKLELSPFPQFSVRKETTAQYPSHDNPSHMQRLIKWPLELLFKRKIHSSFTLPHKALFFTVLWVLLSLFPGSFPVFFSSRARKENKNILLVAWGDSGQSRIISLLLKTVYSYWH